MRLTRGAMICYRRLRPVRALSFDLDDTLYDNGPVIRAAERAMREHLRRGYPALEALTEAHWLAVKQRLLALVPALQHDVTATRQAVLEQLLRDAGQGDAQAQRGAREAMTLFLDWRNRVTVPDASHALLAWLAARYPLVAITNGNVDPARIGLGRYFTAVFAAGGGYRSKPHSDLFRAAGAHLGLPPAQILHVGDHLDTDVYGALLSGQPVVWLNHASRPLHQQRPRLLPHWEIHQLAQLRQLL